MTWTILRVLPIGKPYDGKQLRAITSSFAKDDKKFQVFTLRRFLEDGDETFEMVALNKEEFFWLLGVDWKTSPKKDTSAERSLEISNHKFGPKNTEFTRFTQIVKDKRRMIQFPNWVVGEIKVALHDAKHFFV